jgi:hypothetical protein
MGEVRGTLLRGGGSIDLLDGSHTMYENEDYKTVRNCMLRQRRRNFCFLC